MAQLRSPAHHEGTKPARLEGELETSLPADAGGQSAVREKAKVRGDNRFQSWPEGLPEPYRRHGVDGCGSALACRHHLHPAARRVRVSGSRSGRSLAPSDRLGAGPDDGRRADAERTADGPLTEGSRT